jgi:hypothetical protein
MISLKRIFGNSEKVIVGSLVLSIICVGISANPKTLAEKRNGRNM